jgi:hypothetical protein
MDEGKWLKATHPHALVDYLRGVGQASPRKLRLFAVACCRRIWHLLTDERARRSVEVAERYADTAASDAERLAAQRAAAQCAAALARRTWRSRPMRGDAPPEWNAAYAAERAATATRCIPEESRVVAAMAARAVHLASRRASPEEAPFQAELLRDLFGPLPFRPVQIEPSWLTPNVLALAHTLYEERRFDDVPVLADALEEASCDSRDILGHLRQPGQVHVRGCWCLDALLGRR